MISLHGILFDSLRAGGVAEGSDVRFILSSARIPILRGCEVKVGTEPCVLEGAVSVFEPLAVLVVVTVIVC